MAEKTTKKETKGRPLRTATDSGIPIRPSYGAGDVPAGVSGERPGEFPFQRGARPEGYREKFWTMRQYAGFSTAAQSNARYRMLLERGQTGLSVAFDLPTQIGYDSDHPLAGGEVGKVGVAIDTLEDVETLLDGLPLEKVSISMTINATASILLALVLAAARRRGVDWKLLSGTVQNDILKEYAARGTYAFPPKPSLRLITDLFGFCAGEVPKWNTISISGYHIREAGSTAVQEVAFTLADGIEYVRAAIAAGLPVDEFAPRLSFFFNVHNDFFEEVAKFRAARRLWAEIMKDRFGAADPRSWALRFHSQTAGSTLTAQQPENNVVRVSLQALAAVFGGTQSLHTNSRDEALSLPTEDAVTLALRTQQIIAHESGVADLVDPLGGSYVVEAWTHEIASRAKSEIEKIDKMGGALAAIEAGYIQREIQESAYRAQRAIDSGEKVVVGVNQFTSDDSTSIETFRVDPDVERDQVERLAAFRARRSKDTEAAARRALLDGARGAANLMPLLVSAVDAGTTLGEIVETLRGVFGEYREVATL